MKHLFMTLTVGRRGWFYTSQNRICLTWQPSLTIFIDFSQSSDYINYSIPVTTLYEHCNNAYIQIIAFDPQPLITASIYQNIWHH